MTPEEPSTDGATEQARAYIEKATEHGQPRRYIARRLLDVDGLTQREIADLLNISVGTVNTDLKQTVEPAGRTAMGTVYYPPGRFDNDPDFQARIKELEREIGPNARTVATEEFAGPPVSKRVPIRTTEQQRELRERAIKAAS